MYINTGDLKELYKTRDNTAATQIVSDIAITLHESADNKKIRRFFFRQSSAFDDVETKDISYYVIYRYSTIRKEIVKTFLVIKPPAMNAARCFHFTHVYPMPNLKEKRIDRGPVLLHEQCFHLLGYVTTETKNITSEVRGINLIAFPVGGVNAEHKRLSSVLLSHNRSWQPIVGRAAIIHIGYRSDIGDTRDEDVGIGLLPNESNLMADLLTINEKFRFADGEGMITETHSYIINVINNMPFVDRLRPVGDNTVRALTIEDKGNPIDSPTSQTAKTVSVLATPTNAACIVR